MNGPDGSPFRSQLTLKTVFVACTGVAVAVAAVSALLHTQIAISLTVAAGLAAVALDHAVVRLMRAGMTRPLAITAVVLILLTLLALFIELLVPPIAGQARAFVGQLPDLLREARGTRFYQFLDDRAQLGQRLEELRASALLQRSFTPVLSVLGNIISFAGALVTVAFLTIFMLVFGGQVIDSIVGEARQERQQHYRDVLRGIYVSIGGYLGGLFLICAVNATLTSTFLAIARLPYFLPLGILSGFSSMVPYAGPAIVGAGITVLSLVTGGIWHAVAAAIYFVLYGMLEGNVLSPLIFRRTVHMNPLVTMLSVLFFGELAGVLGAVIAVPAVATLQIIGRELLAIRRDRLRTITPPPAA